MRCNKACLTLGLISAGLFSFSAHAELYSGLSLAYSDAEYRASTWQDASPLLAQVQLGYFFSDYLALEGRYSTSVKREEGLSINGLSSVLFKANMPTTDRLAMYAVAGYSYVRADYQHQTNNDSGASFGVGFHYALSGKTAVTGEFINYLAGDDVRLTALQLGMQFKF
ncbi:MULTISPECIES: outer membrane beta-barrel protein [Vibrio]|uniref:outer membrane beta-barrel protein n=1 Tax=Vibrio TaxID=662 RepID=UPI000C1696E5|nr:MULTISPECIES: outer membrane beta-barrel protein [Vibrio]NNN45433.1 porin family protein [Vibrio sp. 1-1(7)]NNN73283.1 porin family protein [Vibrio sp. 12-2(3-a)]